MYKILRFWLALDAQAGSSLTYLQTPKTGFLVACFNCVLKESTGLQEIKNCSVRTSLGKPCVTQKLLVWRIFSLQQHLTPI